MLDRGQSSAEFTGLHPGRRRSPTTTKRARRAADLAFLRVALFDCSALALSGPAGRRTRRDHRCLCTPRGHGVQAAPRAPGGRPRRGEASYQVLRRSIGRGRSIRSRCATSSRSANRLGSGHRKPWRSTNLLERSLGEVRRRTKVIGRFPGETSCLSVVWAVLDLFFSHASNGATPPTSTANTSTASNTSEANQRPHMRRSPPPTRLTPGT